VLSIKSFKKFMLNVLDLKIWDSISEILDSTKFTIFWLSLLLASGILGLFLNLLI
jgi:hypothetical protein